ncbi:MAG: arsenate reductase (glutaredoxin) [Gammaproteobacteria bacterium]|nr:arsenate reductase (glutaredoxin) [Gammaproteobacteria bacterium]NNM20369.1 arsenate reductase (glutaredoxin) [Gammaproteobacteria bacterium]
MEVTIYHNPRCSKSRATLALLEKRGIEPRVILYLETPPSAQQIRELLGLLGMTPRELIRSGEKEYRELRLSDPATTDEDLISAMHNCPRLLQRPIVVVNGAARIGRPPESVLDIL